MASGSSPEQNRAHRFGKARVWLAENGVVHIVYEQDVEITLTDAEEMLDGLREHFGVVRRPLLIDMRGVRQMDRDARFHFATEKARQTAAACALAVTSPVGRVIASFFMRVARPAFPTRIVADEAGGVAWLSAFLPRSDDERDGDGLPMGDGAPEIVETTIAHCWMDEDRVLHIRVKQDAVIEIEDAVDSVTVGRQMVGATPYVMVVDMARVRSMTREAREHLANGPHGKDSVGQAVAVVVRSPVARVLGNFFLGFNKPERPVKLFSSADDAARWARGFLEHTGSGRDA